MTSFRIRLDIKPPLNQLVSIQSRPFHILLNTSVVVSSVSLVRPSMYDVTSSQYHLYIQSFQYLVDNSCPILCASVSSETDSSPGQSVDTLCFSNLLRGRYMTYSSIQFLPPFPVHSSSFEFYILSFFSSSFFFLVFETFYLPICPSESLA